MSLGVGDRSGRAWLWERQCRQPQKCHIPAGDSQTCQTCQPQLGKQWQEGGLERRGRAGCEERTEVTGEEFSWAQKRRDVCKGKCG